MKGHQEEDPLGTDTCISSLSREVVELLRGTLGTRASADGKVRQAGGTGQSLIGQSSNQRGGTEEV